MPVAIRIENLSKSYHIGESSDNLREAIAALPKRIISRNNQETTTPHNILWALKGISFKVEQGQVVGIIGPNGAGKTTMLKLLSGVTRPTQGRIQISGRVSVLIELGAGFHPELTGRENIFLNGAILGLGENEIARKFDSIVAFAGLEEFIDTPVKRYSSGMYVRLGFAVAAHVDPDVLLVDEVLAVGDHDFRVRCIDRFRELQDKGVTTVIVSHSRDLIQSLCTRTICLRGGQIIYDGKPEDAWRAYLASQPTRQSDMFDKSDSPDSEMTITHIETLDQQGTPCLFFATGEPMQARIAFEAHAHVQDPVFFARWYRDGQLVHGTNSGRFQVTGSYHPGETGTAYISYKALHLLDGTYDLTLGIEKSLFSRSSYDQAPSISIRIGSDATHGAGIAHLEHCWQVERVTPENSVLRDHQETG